VGLEIERKFLLLSEDWRAATSGSPVRMRQGYLQRSGEAIVRVRVAGERAFLTIKGKTCGISRSEFEYEIPAADAEELLRIADGPLIDKTRHYAPVDGHTFEIDEFHGDNQGLVVAELELESEEQTFPRPAWLGEDVSSDPRYRNAWLSLQPYQSWPEVASAGLPSGPDTP